MRAAAHDLRNLLTVIRGHCELAACDLEGGRSRVAGERLRKATLCVDDCEQIILSAFFSRKRPAGTFDLGDVVRKIADQASDNLLQFGIDLETNLPPEFVIIAGDSLEITRALFNLTLNARDAIMARAPGTGKITISLYTDKSIAVLQVEDDGIGFSKGLLPNLWNLKSTQEHGHGLRVVKQTVDKLRGWIDVSSRPGCGTRFSLSLPRVAGTVAA